MNFKECFISKNGISCISSNHVKIFNKLVVNDYLIGYLTIRCFEFILNDFIANKNFISTLDSVSLTLE